MISTLLVFFQKYVIIYIINIITNNSKNMDNKIKLTEIIRQNHLFPENIKAYVQPFSDGSDFFWDKSPSFTQFLNDCNGRLEQFYRNIRQQKKLNKNSIYFERQSYTQNQEQILNSAFFKRLKHTYLFSRNYDRLIKSTDSKQTFYLCLIKPNQQLLCEFKKIMGKFLFIFENETFQLNDKKLNYIRQKNIHMIFNFNNVKSNDFFDF